MDRLTGRKVTITVDGRDHFQLDGDTVGECSTMTAEVRPRALTMRVPRTGRAEVAAYPGTELTVATGAGQHQRGVRLVDVPGQPGADQPLRRFSQVAAAA